MSFLQLDEGTGMYIKHDWNLGEWLVDKQPIGAKDVLLDPKFKTGYGKWTVQDGNNQFDFKEDQVVGVKRDDWRSLIQDDYKRAFETMMYVKGQGVYIWRSESKMQGKTFDEAMTAAWDAANGNPPPNQVPYFTVEQSERIQAGAANGFVGKLKFVKWVDRPQDFDSPEFNSAESVNELDQNKQADDRREEDIPF